MKDNYWKVINIIGKEETCHTFIDKYLECTP